MVKIQGKYLHVKNKNFSNYLMGFGVPEKYARPADNLSVNVSIEFDGKNIQIVSEFIKNQKNTLTLDKEVEELLPSDVIIYSTATLNGNTVSISSRMPTGVKMYRELTFSETELVMKMSADDPTIPHAEKWYIRLE